MFKKTRDDLTGFFVCLYELNATSLQLIYLLSHDIG